MEPVDFGVCRLAVVPVRKESREASEQITQLLFGDHYEVINFSPDRKWAHITIYSDQTEGWLDIRQHHVISKEYFEQINATDYKITTEIASPVLYKKSPLTIVMGSVVPISNSELFKIEEQFAFNGESKSLGQRRDADFVKSVAKKYLQAPFLAGGKSPFGIDDTGLVQMIFRIAGYSLPRNIRQQLQAGKKVKSFEDSSTGDLAFFSEKGKEVSHVGLIIDGDKVIHASGYVRMDPITDEGILNPETKIYSHLFHSIRRII
ncbi:MAG TPA: C40 family peptidase [Cyclobacteriaceae bacterium]|nr:C40 family peptidase [Cyclobacteriaceae bacterium]